MIYLTYNDPPSGIYSGQVIDVCNYLNENFNADIRLVALISLRKFRTQRRKIKNELPSAVVLPMFPGVGNWKLNYFLLYLVVLFLGKQSVIARGPFAAGLALVLKKSKMVQRVCFDARGSYEAEFNEYQVAGKSDVNKQIGAIEENAILNADLRIAVSNKLVDHWQERFGYKGTDHVVIPCTLNSKTFTESPMQGARASFGFTRDDIVFVYSGSSAGWQSLQLADDFLSEQMKKNSNVKVLFLTDRLPENMKVVKEHPDRVQVKWLQIDKMAEALSCCDYGLLIREDSVTNRVSSPVKFAEYLAAGLQMIISDTIGDYPGFVKQHACGYVLDRSGMMPELANVPAGRKNGNREIALKYFSKSSYQNEYANVLKHLSEVK